MSRPPLSQGAADTVMLDFEGVLADKSLRFVSPKEHLLPSVLLDVEPSPAA
ncbi:hypothetical protein [Prosthecobacter sp.]